MKKLFFAIALSLVPTFSAVDLVAPFTVDLISTKHPYWDTIAITTYFANIGNTPTPTKSFDAVIFEVKVDSFSAGNFASHNIPASYYLGAGQMVVLHDTTIAPKGPFSVLTWCDPLLFFGEGGGEVVNNTRSQAYNFHPKIFIDTIILIDTMKITLHDTVKVAVHDTIKVSVRDTIIKRDTVKYCPPTLAKASAAYRPAITSVVYNAVGAPVWNGSLPAGEYPRERLKPGLYLLVQGGQAHRFRIAYK